MLSIEDRKFYEHNGVDWAGHDPGAVQERRRGRHQQGGSTITEQLIKNTFSNGRKRDLEDEDPGGGPRGRLEKQLTKSQILEDYLNLVSFGNSAYGIEVAAERYFPSTTPLAPDLPQSALLAGLMQAPEALNPITHPGAAARRRSEVLQAMVDEPQDHAAAATAAKSVPLPTTVFYPHSGSADYYIDAVRTPCSPTTRTSPAIRARCSARPSRRGPRPSTEGGLKIYTNYDPAMQFVATSR